MVNNKDYQNVFWHMLQRFSDWALTPIEIAALCLVDKLLRRQTIVDNSLTIRTPLGSVRGGGRRRRCGAAAVKIKKIIVVKRRRQTAASGRPHKDDEVT